MTADRFSHYDDRGKALISKAYDIASAALAEDLRYDGSPFMEHPLGVATIVSDEIGLQAECVAAVFLHETLRRHPDTDISGWDFPAEIMGMVEGLNKIATIKPKDTRLEAEVYKRLIVQYSTDPRVTILKIADRLEVMRHLEMFPGLSRERKILETLMLYIPLAHQLGLYNIKAEMEDIYLRFAEPEQYRSITNKLKATEKDREKLMEEFIEPLKKKLSDAGIKYKVKVRTKSAFSIFNKMRKQKVPFEKVYDVFAMRFIIDCDGDRKEELAQCWKVFSYVTETYTPDMDRLRDWLTNPKPNGYESLHITVNIRDNCFIEVQIRTKRMDEEAENGHASHWSYKGIRHEETLDRWLTSVRYNLEHKMDTNPEDIPQPPDNEIFVYTPSGELRILPKGASMLDFAFSIHTNLGMRCTGGLVNGKAVSIREKLKTGDVVEIKSSKNQKPSAAWLDFVVSSKARGKIRQAVNEAFYKKAAEGKELLDRRLKNWKLEFPDDMMAEFNKKNHFTTLHAFYAAIGDGSLDINVIKNYIIDHDEMVAQANAKAAENAQAAAAERLQHARENGGAGQDDIIINAKNLKGLDYKMAKCCNPVYGDDVFGFVTRDDGIKIHRISCPNAARLLDMYPYRIQKVRWAENPSTGSFQVALKVIAAMEPSVINSVMDTINAFKSSLRTFNLVENNRIGTYEMTMKVSVPSNTELDKVVSQLRHVKNVLKVTRL